VKNIGKPQYIYVVSHNIFMWLATKDKMTTECIPGTLQMHNCFYIFQIN